MTKNILIILKPHQIINILYLGYEDYSNKYGNNSFGIEKNNEKNINNKLIKDINYFHIIKSYLCFKDKKTKIISNFTREETENIIFFINKGEKEMNKYNYKNNDDKMEDNYLDYNKEKK